MPECPKCNKKFKLEEALIQHLNDKKDEKHRLHDKKDESQSEICSTPIIGSISKISPRRHFDSVLGCISRIYRLKTKPNLTENEKKELNELTEYIKEDNKREVKRLNIKFGLPEDTPFGASHRLRRAESELKSEESHRKLEESKNILREINRQGRKRREEDEQNIEHMNKDTWEKIDKSAKEFKDKNPYFKLSTTPIKPEENIECAPCISPACPPPLKNKAKKNKLLNMSTG